jgi:hypothetical protein
LEADVRTTLTIDDDVLAAAKAQATLERSSVGEVISRLARQSLTSPQQSGAYSLRTGLPVLPRRPGGQVLTSEHVRQIQEQMDLEEAQAAWSFSTPTS